MKKQLKIIYIFVILLAVVLLSLRIALPTIVQSFVNNKLDESPDYSGHVGDVDLSLIRGAYRIEDVVIEKNTGNIPVPLFSATSIEFSILWSALLNGAVVAEIEANNPSLNIVDSTTEQSQQTGENANWIGILDDLVPLRVDQVSIDNGELHFRNYDNEPVVDIYFSEISGDAYNLTNSRDLSESLVANISVTALAMEEAEMEFIMSFDPSSNEPTFDIDTRLLSLPITSLDAFIRAYAPFDLEAGSLDIASELASENGSLEGYIKPVIRDLKVFEWHEDIEEDGDNIFIALWEILVGLTSEIFENQPRDQFATNIPISGDLSNPDANILATLGNILRNAFIEAFQADLDNTVSLDLNSQENEGENPDASAEEGSAGNGVENAGESEETAEDSVDE